jgi:hypothetical protein
LPSTSATAVESSEPSISARGRLFDARTLEAAPLRDRKHLEILNHQKVVRGKLLRPFFHPAPARAARANADHYHTVANRAKARRRTSAELVG